MSCYEGFPNDKWALQKTVVYSSIHDILETRPCILKMKKFLPICVNAKTALWRLAGAKQCCCTFKLPAAIPKTVKKNLQSQKLVDKSSLTSEIPAD